MLVINYSGNKPQQDRFKFAVNGDNNSQTIKFVLKKQQGDIDLSSPSFTIYFLCQSQDKRFVDKAEITTVSEEGNDIILEYKLLGKHTQFKAIDVGVSFEDENQEVVYKTASATISIQNGIMADDEIANKYPTELGRIEAELPKKATVWQIDYDFDELGSFLYENASKLKEGDLIHSNTFGGTAIIEEKSDTYCHILLCSSTYKSVFDYIYIYSSQDEEWQFDSETETPIGGTKLYKHEVVIHIDGVIFPSNGNTSTYVITDNDTPFTNLADNLLNFLYDKDTTVVTIGIPPNRKTHIKFAQNSEVISYSKETHIYPTDTAWSNSYIYRTMQKSGMGIYGQSPGKIMPFTREINADLTTGAVSFGDIHFSYEDMLNLSFVSDTVTPL